MAEPTPFRPVRAPAPLAGLLDGAFRPSTELPDAMQALLDALAVHERDTTEPALVVVQR